MLRTGVTGDSKCSDIADALDGILSFDCLRKQVVVLKLFAKSLQKRERLIKRHWDSNLRKILARR